MILRNIFKTCCTCINLNINRHYSKLSLTKYININIKRNFSATHNVNTNISKDIILYKYDNPKKFKMLNIFALCQFGFWNYLSYFAYTTMKDAPVEKPNPEAAWWRRINLGENKYRNTITALSFLMGYGILCAAWMFSLKSVRYLILRKGGQAVSFVTYGPFGKNRIMTVDLKHVSSQETREAARGFLPLKVQHQRLYYVLDLNGEFRNKQLFDATAGLRRTWKNS